MILLHDAKGGSVSQPAGASRWRTCLARLGLSRRKRTDDFVAFDDVNSLEHPLMWSLEGARPEAGRSLSEQYMVNVTLPKPAEDVDY